MKREKTASLVSRWKKAFSAGKPEPEESKPEIPAKREQETETISKPVTFRLSRLENPEDFERMRFVIKACVKDAVYPFKMVLHVEQTRTGSRLVACDGLRMHVAEISKKIKSGDYKPAAAKETITLGEPLPDIQFPNWIKAVPEKTSRRGVISLENAGLGKDRKQTEKLSLAFNALVKKIGEPVNLRYLEDLPKREWTVYCQDERQKAILLKEKSAQEKVFAVILPIPKAA
jgi:hypothetical protein